jgi:predicted amidophosphoribosyltransferase
MRKQLEKKYKVCSDCGRKVYRTKQGYYDVICRVCCGKTEGVIKK